MHSKHGAMHSKRDINSMWRLLDNDGKVISTAEVKKLFGGKNPSSYQLWMAGIHKVKLI